MRPLIPGALTALVLLACGGSPSLRTDVGLIDAGAEPGDDLGLDLGGAEDSGSGGGEDVGPRDGGQEDAGAVLPEAVRVRVLLDGAPATGARVSYGGSGIFTETSSTGWVEVILRPRTPGPDTVIIAAHPEARTHVALLGPGRPSVIEIALERFSPVDNPAYRFADPGEPDRRATTNQCAHCHVTMNEAWITSSHRESARNPILLDVYTGVSRAATTSTACDEASGSWVTSRVPGSDVTGARCHLGDGALDVLNPDCVSPPCEGPEMGDCAGCHAPGIDGATSGRGLLEARGRAFEYGVHCDVCHRVESVRLGEAPGVAGALRILRPSERDGFGLNEDGWLPVTFGPSWDSPNPKMGSVPRAHFLGPELCAGCHEQERSVLVAGVNLDPVRWPSGRLPIYSTYSEWRRGPYADAVSCQGCHMPPDPAAENGGDLQLLADASTGIAGGWPRPPGAVRSHAFVGPRTEGAGLLQMAASVRVTAEVQGAAYDVRVVTRNVGAGHALPTGAPSRQLFLRVEATCGGAALAAVGGDAIGPLGGYEEWRLGPFEASGWPRARAGDRLFALADGGRADYDGPPPFESGGRFTAAEKGRTRWLAAGTAEILSVDDGRIELDAEFSGTVQAVVRVRPGASGPEALAGRPGTSFARVTSGRDGALGVPHHAAVDVVRDDRLKPRQARETTHRFRVPQSCSGQLAARAVLVYRPLPRFRTERRGWSRSDIVMAEGEP
ncbi:MAG: hypothetical protein AAFZ18_27085 [Myxococcota bacterium]